MALTPETIAQNRLILPLIQQQSAALLERFRLNPRLGAVFATQQRWLLAHAALAQSFSEGSEGAPLLTLSRYFNEVTKHQIASRNTADAFIKEMLHYGYAVATVDPNDRRSTPITVSPETLATLRAWTMVHLQTLDRMDSGGRLAAYLETPGAFANMQIEITKRVLTNSAIRQPQNTFSLFTWVNNGGVIMDWLITSLDADSGDGQRYGTGITSVSQISAWVTLSRTHLGRKLREAEAMGSMGWSGTRGESAMWVSAGFVREMVEAQAVKLAVIDAACDVVLPRRGGQHLSSMFQTEPEPLHSPL